MGQPNAVSRAYRRHTVRIGIAGLWLVPAAFFAVFALDLSRDGASIPAGQRADYGALALPFAALAVRTWRIAIFSSPSGVVVRNVLRSTRLAWEEIPAFEWGAWRGPGQDRRVPELLAALNEDLARARGWPAAPPSGAPGG